MAAACPASPSPPAAPDTITKRTTVTDAEGVAVLEALAPSAQYTVTVAAHRLPESGARKRSSSARDRPRRSTSRCSLAGVTEAVTVTATTPLVDVTSAITGQDITLQLTESLPTGRSYQSYLQLVPGVMPDDQASSGNPAARSGLNYSDIGGTVGISADNVYYFDGINVTDPVTGTFGANLNTEIIQEQHVITGAIPAEFVGAPGLISNVVTKSGSNDLPRLGQLLLPEQRPDGRERERRRPRSSRPRTAPSRLAARLMRDKAWFFGSYRYTNREDDVSTLDTNEFMRTVDNTQHQGFAKASWAATTADLLSFSYMSDPTDVTGRRQRDITNARDRARVQGGGRYGATYTRVWGGTLLEIGANKHNGEVTDLSALRLSRNDVLFQTADARVLTDEQVGGYGRDLIDQRDNQAIRGSLQKVWGNHTFKGGAEWNRSDNFRDTLYVDTQGFTTLADKYRGVGINAAQIAAGGWTGLQFDVSTTSDFNGLMRTIDASADRAAFYAAYDANRDGVISQAEAGTGLVFNTANSLGGVNYDRDFQAATGPQETFSKGLSFFVQDEITFNRLTLNVGLRTERWEHFATTGANIYTFPWEFAPRISAAYDSSATAATSCRRSTAATTTPSATT